MSATTAAALFTPPASPGAPCEVAADIFWARLPLPFQLDHVNLYLLRDADGWTAIDTGIKGSKSRAGWAEMFTFIGGSAHLKRLIISHHHIDHIGLASWLQAETGCEVVMSEIEHRATLKGHLPDPPDRQAKMKTHLLWLGCEEAEADRIVEKPFHPSQFSESPPAKVRYLTVGETITLAGRDWQVLGGKGHSPGPIMLHDAAHGLLIAGDQILASISPFVGTFGDAPHASPVRDYLAFLDEAGAEIPEGTLILPGHGLPFRDVHARLASLKAHHLERLDQMVEACREQAQTIRSLTRLLFKRDLSGVEPMAFAELLAHANLLIDEGRLVSRDEGGVRQYRAG